MNNLHRELAPISDAAWPEIENEARRTVKSHLAGRRIVDVLGPEGPALATVGTGHREGLDAAPGVIAHRRLALPVVDLRVPFTLSREAVDDVERGSKDSDWQPVIDAAKSIARAEDGVIFTGYPQAGLVGIATGKDEIELPDKARSYPDAVSAAVSDLRLAGIAGPYALALGAKEYTAVNQTADYGYPVRAHLERIVEEIIWAPAIMGACLVSRRGGDYELHLGQDISIGYLSHDSESVELYLEESLAFRVLEPGAAVVFEPAG